MLLITLTLGLLLAGLLYVFLTWNFKHWRKRRVPGPKPNILNGNFPNLFTMKRHIVHDLTDIYVKYKSKYDAVGVFSGRAPQLLIVSPELAHRVFVTDFKHFHDNELSEFIDEKSDFIFANNPFTLTGELWKQRRAEVTPGLTISRVKSVYPVTNKVCKKMTEWLNKQIRLGAPEGVDGKHMSLCFTSEMVTDCVLGLEAESFSDNPTPIMGHIRELFKQTWIVLLYFLLLSVVPSLRGIIKMRVIPKRIELFFTDLMQTAVNARQAQVSDRGDFLDFIVHLAKKRNLDTRQLTARTMTFLLDGFETTATVMSHLLLLLGRNEDVQQRLREEIEEHLKDGQLDFDKLSDLPYLDACLQESIRIFPPAFMSNKLCTESLELPNRDGPNFIVEKGTTVTVPHYCYMMDDEYFPQPQEFQPERFMESDAAKKYRERGVFMGFGDGPRICIGMRFAVVQIKAAIVEVLTNFNVKVNPKTRQDNELDPLAFVSGLKDGVWLDFKERKKNQ